MYDEVLTLNEFFFYFNKRQLGNSGNDLIRLTLYGECVYSIFIGFFSCNRYRMERSFFTVFFFACGVLVISIIIILSHVPNSVNDTIRPKELFFFFFLS